MKYSLLEDYLILSIFYFFQAVSQLLKYLRKSIEFIVKERYLGEELTLPDEEKLCSQIFRQRLFDIVFRFLSLFMSPDLIDVAA